MNLSEDEFRKREKENSNPIQEDVFSVSQF